MSMLPHEHQSGVFVNAPLKSVVDCLLRWGKELADDTVAENRTLPLSAAWSHVDEDRKIVPDRAFLIPLNNWTAYFDNNRREFISTSRCNELCRRLQVDTCYVYCDNRTPRMEGSCQYGHVRPDVSERGVKIRQVMVIHDGGWKFEEFGEPLPYERLDRYTLRKKANRLSPDIMQGYGQALGIPFWNDSAYGNEVALLRWNATQPGEFLKAGDAEAGFQRIVNAARGAGFKGKVTWLKREGEESSRTEEL